jgi:hypothetical protein
VQQTIETAKNTEGSKLHAIAVAGLYPTSGGKIAYYAQEPCVQENVSPGNVPLRPAGAVHS